MNTAEKNDGASLQIIYAGSGDAAIYAQSTLIGQPIINSIEYSNQIKSPTEQYEEYESSNQHRGFLFLGLGAFTVIGFLFLAYRSSKRTGTGIKDYFDRSDFIIMVQPIMFFGVAIYHLFFATSSLPPFGF